jgi:hypothetical protein
MRIKPGNLVKLNIENVTSIVFNTIANRIGLVIYKKKDLTNQKDCYNIQWIGTEKFRTFNFKNEDLILL